MAIKTKDEILKEIKTRVGDNADDDTISFIENVTDTLNDYETRTKDSTDWKTKYEENDKAWRTKYKDRFFNKKPDADENDDEYNQDDDSDKPKTFEDLFKEEK